MNQDQDQEEAKIKPASKGRPRRRAVEDEHLTPRQYQNMRYYTNRGSIVNKLSRLKDYIDGRRNEHIDQKNQNRYYREPRFPYDTPLSSQR